MPQPTVRLALAVDDDPIILMHACDILADAGFQPLEATTGEAAIDVLEANAGAVVLLFTDVEMPGTMNGFALARATAERWPETEIVVASGRAEPRAGDMPDGATFLGKPFSAEIVHDHLRHKLPAQKQPGSLKKGV